MQNSTLTAPTAPNTSTKSVLARLLATENISVEHSNVPTAAFDLKTRTLILPRWKDMSNALYDMLVGHEVSHALNTPQDGWRTGTDALSVQHGVSTEIAKQYLNIAEDARIERLIKARFPGLQADFFKGYGELHAKNFFETRGADLNSLCLGDRVNLHFKLGLHVGTALAFNADEAAIRDAVGAANTWEETVAAASRMLAVDAEKWKKQQDEQQQESDGTDASGSGEGNESQTQGSGSESPRGEGEEQSESGNGSSGDESTPSSGTDENATEGGSGGDSGKSSGKGESRKPTNGMPSPRTNSAMEKAMKSLNDSSRSPNVARVRMAESQDAVVPFTTVLADFERIVARNHRGSSFMPFRNADYKAASTSMATAFDRRKAADTWKRTTIAKTGGIDPLRMTQYRWNEDIFRRTTRITQGKNHGIVILLDWSGSMGNIMQATIGQLIILADFCRTSNIPFEVFAFSDSVYCTLPEGMDDWSQEAYKARDTACKAFTKGEHGTATTGYVRLLNFMSSRMTAAQYERMKSLLWSGWGLLSGDRQYRMGSTPTVAALHHVEHSIQRFAAAARVQIVHTVVLTDGDATDSYLCNNSRENWNTSTHYVAEDAATGASYDVTSARYYDADGKGSRMRRGRVQFDDSVYNLSVAAAIDRLRRRTGSRVHWIGLHESHGSTIPSMSDFKVDTKRTNWSRDGYARGTASGFDTAVIVAAARFGGAGNDQWIEKQLSKADEKIDSAKTGKGLLTAVVNKQAMANSVRSLSTLIGEYLALA
jgi:hypothetical protein